MNEGDPIEIPITGELDLHTFQPREVAQLLDAYFQACAGKGIQVVRVVHGKGTGTLRATVHAYLRKDPLVASFALADEQRGSWGATIVTLRKLPAEQQAQSG